MNLKECEELVKLQMTKHGLLLKGWRFKWDNSFKRFGVCKYQPKVIGLSTRLVTINDKERVLDTIQHEIAHALVGHGYGHGNVWMSMCVKIGCKPRRCYTQNDTIIPEMRYLATCESCETVYKKVKKPREGNRRCRCQIGRSWDSCYLLNYIDTHKN